MYRKLEFLGPEKVVRDYKRLRKLKADMHSKQRKVETLLKQIDDLERRTNWCHAGGVTEIYKGFPLTVRGDQVREHKGYDTVEVRQCYDTNEDNARWAQVYRLHFSADELERRGDDQRYGLKYTRHFGQFRSEDHGIMFLSKNDAIEQAKEFVALGKNPPKHKESWY